MRTLGFRFLSPASRHAMTSVRMRQVIFVALLAPFAKGVNADVPQRAEPAPIPMLGVHTLLVQTEGAGATPAVTAPLDTQPSGSALLVLNGGYTSNADGPTDNHDNTWSQLGRSVVFGGYGGRFNVKAYLALPARGGSDHTISIVKHGNEAGEISVPVIEIRNAGVLQDVAQNYPSPNLAGKYYDKLARALGRSGHSPTDGPTLTSGDVTTTGPALLIAVWWGDATVYHMTAVPDNGFAVIDSFLDLPPNSGVQCAVAYRQVASAGVYHVSWTGTPAQGAILWLFAFQSRH
ncbi:hypothetical protein GCM10007862_11650 [Dyella lipolytica]|nr:hypothetical protein GCM10007862_11650 [Dyella lipolytica]